MSRFAFLTGLGIDLKGTLETQGPDCYYTFYSLGTYTLLHERFEDKKE